MDYENYRELYEAVYFFDRINCCSDDLLPQRINVEAIKKSGINESIWAAVIRILVVSELLYYDGRSFILTKENKERHEHILNNLINKNNKHYIEMFDKVLNESQFFFDSLSELEYEIYSRCDFQITFGTGKEVVKHINFSDRKVLELGGNSGGLGTAVVSKYKDCRYTIVDTKIPCMIGNEFKESNNLDITFIEGNVFELNLPNELYDHIIIMNLLHDFDDMKCLTILHNGVKFCDSHTKFLIIEDILISEFEPKEVIMHGLRLSTECRGGKQRTLAELAVLFSKINYKLEKTIKLSNIHTLLVMGSL